MKYGLAFSQACLAQPTIEIAALSVSQVLVLYSALLFVLK